MSVVDAPLRHPNTLNYLKDRWNQKLFMYISWWVWEFGILSEEIKSEKKINYIQYFKNTDNSEQLLRM